MPAKPFHLGWFQTFQANEWKTPYTLSEGVPFTGDFYVELAQVLERACFDFLMLEDTVGIPRGLVAGRCDARRGGERCLPDAGQRAGNRVRPRWPYLRRRHHSRARPSELARAGQLAYRIYRCRCAEPPRLSI